MSEGSDDSERKQEMPETDKDGATGDRLSPSASPREKKTKLLSADSETPVPVSPSRRRPLGVQDLLVAASPPKFINVEDVMRLANGVTDMALAHEIAVSREFRLEQLEAKPNTLEGQIKEVMHKAFWDSLAESLQEDPPDYTHALVLLKEVKEGLMDLLLPHHQRLRANIDEVLDLDLIEQQAEHGSLDFRHYASFITDKMAALCAPVRDELIASLRDITDIVTLYRKILEALKLMKLDMVNFTIAHFRPYVQQHSVDYEKEKFKSLLEIQRENGVDGLKFTRSWLHSSAERVKSRQSTTESEEVSAAASSETSPPAAGSFASATLNVAFLELLQWDDDRVFPETLLIDQQRFFALRDQVQWLTLVTSVLIVTYNTVGAAIAGVAELKMTLTSQISVLTRDVSRDKLPEAMVTVAEQVNKEVNKSLSERGFPSMKSEQQQMLKGQICVLTEPDNAVHKLMKDRLLTFIEHVLSNPWTKDAQLPAGYNAVSEELSGLVGSFLHLVSYNQAVFGSYYADIISSILDSTATVTSS